MHPGCSELYCGNPQRPWRHHGLQWQGASNNFNMTRVFFKACFAYGYKYDDDDDDNDDAADDDAAPAAAAAAAGVVVVVVVVVVWLMLFSSLDKLILLRFTCFTCMA